VVQLLEQEAILEIAEEEVKRRMFRARNRHIEYSKADYHGQSVETSIKMLYQKLSHLKSNPDPGVLSFIPCACLLVAILHLVLTCTDDATLVSVMAAFSGQEPASTS
jgi:hypothetical protein